jgi:hypothetical protein
MRLRTFAIIFVCFFSPVCAANTLAQAEETCSELGFKKKTESYGDCVLELHSRANKKTSSPTNANPDHQACTKFGFTAGTESHSNCKLQMEMARRQAQQKQAEFELATRQYEQERKEYEARLAAYENEKKRRQGDAMMRFGLALMGGNSPYASENLANAGRAALGMPPTLPPRPQIQNFTINAPDGRMTNCSVMGNNINCF